MHHWIDSQAISASLLANAGELAVIPLDTEFVRERTFFARLGLVQVAIADQVLLIDPLQDDTEPVVKALLDHPAPKVMHGASEDLQALEYRYGCLPRPLRDTQIAAALAGLGAGASYQKLVRDLLGVELEKGQTRSDWLQRPLSAAQLHYAAEDVHHLAQVWELLESRLQTLGRLDWLIEDCDRLLANAAVMESDPQPHLSMRSAERLDPERQARLRRMLLWREQRARRSDRPRNWILDAELAVRLAHGWPLARSEFDRLLDAQPRSPQRGRDELWGALAEPLSAEQRDIPLLRPSDRGARAQVVALQAAVRSVAAPLELPDGLLASRRHLETLLNERRWPASLQGWRKPLLEPVLTPLLEQALPDAQPHVA